MSHWPLQCLFGRAAVIAGVLFILSMLNPVAEATEPVPQVVEQTIEEEVEQCRKDCIETTCAPQFRSCVNASGDASTTCKTLREDCETRCVEVDCMT